MVFVCSWVCELGFHCMASHNEVATALVQGLLKAASARTAQSKSKSKPAAGASRVSSCIQGVCKLLYIGSKT